jgi:hypothetical protein
MIKRLSYFIETSGISVRSFEQKISASDGMIRRAINNNTDIQSKWLINIAENYPQLNIEWLLTGVGDMLKPVTNQPPITVTATEASHLTDNASIIGNLLQRVESLSREVGRLQLENEYLRERISKLIEDSEKNTISEDVPIANIA